MEFNDFFAGEDDHNRRLDKIIRKLIHKQNLSQIYSCIRKGLIKVNQKKASPDTKVQQGDCIKIPSFLLEPNNQNLSDIHEAKKQNINSNNNSQNFEICFENNDILIINKPYDTLVHGSENSLDKKVKEYFNNMQNKPASLSFSPGPLHRLDKKTTGLLAFSLSLKGANWFSQNIAIHTIKKTYIAIIQGTLKQAEEWIDYISTEDKNLSKNFYTVKTSNSQTDNSKKAISKIQPLLYGKINNTDYTLAKIQIETGRTHQIRAQAAYHNFPLLGDTAYGGIKLNEKQDFFLHAIKLEFPKDNPINLPKTIITSIPKQWIDFLNKTSNDKMLLNKNIEDII